MEILGLIFLIFVALIALSGRSPKALGNRGERKVNRVLLSGLPNEEYAIFHDVTLYSSHGKTQVDHIVVSRFGVFVIETKYYSGWVFGNERQQQWTQVIYRTKHRFMNPLRQNFKHTEAVKTLLALDDRYVFSVVVFAGSAKLKTDLPANVMYLRELCPHILSHEQLLLSPDKFDSMITSLVDHIEGKTANKPPPHLSVVDTNPICPRCSGKMVLRKARTGPSAGDKFWGCANFPKCRGTRST